MSYFSHKYLRSSFGSSVAAVALEEEGSPKSVTERRGGGVNEYVVEGIK